jgi:hypothetical protein
MQRIFTYPVLANPIYGVNIYIFTYLVLANPIYGVNTCFSAGRSPNVGSCTCNYTVLAKPARFWPTQHGCGHTHIFGKHCVLCITINQSQAYPGACLWGHSQANVQATQSRPLPLPALVHACGVTVRPTCGLHQPHPLPLQVPIHWTGAGASDERRPHYKKNCTLFSNPHCTSETLRTSSATLRLYPFLNPLCT